MILFIFMLYFLSEHALYYIKILFLIFFPKDHLPVNDKMSYLTKARSTLPVEYFTYIK